MEDAPEPGIETQMLNERRAKMDELIGKHVRLAAFPRAIDQTAPPFGAADSRGQASAIVTSVYSPEVVNVITLDTLTPLTNLQGWTRIDTPPYICSVFWRHESGVQYVALVKDINDAGQLDLLVLSDGYVDLGLGPGKPVVRERVTRGQGHLCWLKEMDPWSP